MQILHIPCLEDNYSYLIIDETTKAAAVVDPVEPDKIVRVAEENGVDKFVLTTHHHRDHAGGNDKIKDLVRGIKVYGGSLDKVRGCTDEVENGDQFSLSDNIRVLALHTPCHTKGHISYYLTGKEGEDSAVFTGDTLALLGYQFAGTVAGFSESFDLVS